MKVEREKKMNNDRNLRNYILMAISGAVLGGLIVAVVTKALPKMMSEMMKNMMIQMQAEGCNPDEM